MKAYLFNDTGDENHAGCKAVMRSINGQLARIKGLEIVGRHKVGTTRIDETAYDTAEAIIMNGEGTIHHSTKRAVFLMSVIADAKEAGKRVLLINALFQQYEAVPDLLGGLALLSVREPRSAAFARRFGGQPHLLLDSAADPAFLTEGQAQPLKHGLVVGWAQKDLPEFRTAFAALKATPYSMFRVGFDDAVATLRQARAYVTGQHHGVYAAALAGCPFVTVRSTSHKIESFIDWTGLPIPICQSAAEIGPAIKFAVANPSIYRELGSFMAEQKVVDAPMIAQALGLTVV